MGWYSNRFQNRHTALIASASHIASTFILKIFCFFSGNNLLHTALTLDNLCRYILITSVVSLVILVTCSVLSVPVLVITLPNSPVHTLTSKSTQIVVAENDTVIVGKYSSNNKPIKISELILRGDAEHRCNVLAVSSSLLMYRYKTEYKMFNQTTIVDNQPVLNEMYVYLLAGSQVQNEICLGNVSGSPNATLYGYNNENEFNNYASYSVVGIPTFQQSLVVGGPERIICVNVTFVIQNSNYYFFMLKLPKQGTTYRYKTTAKEKYLNYKDYLTNSTLCTVSNGHKCTLQLSTTSESTVLVYTIPNYGFGSKINHLDITVSFSKFNTTLTLVCSLGSCVFVIVFIIILFVAMFIFCRRYNKSKRVWRGSTYDSISTVIN